MRESFTRERELLPLSPPGAWAGWRGEGGRRPGEGLFKCAMQ